MSSILIKNIEMPKSCDRCKLRDRHVDAFIPYDTCFWTGKTVDPWTFGMKDGHPENCPFTQLKDHGQLIDVDALKSWLKEWYDLNADLKIWQLLQILEDEQQVPTIILADKENT